MHEMTVAKELLEAMLDSARRNEGRTILRADIRLGPLSCVNEENLRFGFHVLANDTPAEKCELQMVRTPLDARCRRCDWEGRVEDIYDPFCPKCGSFVTCLSEDRSIVLESIKLE